MAQKKNIETINEKEQFISGKEVDVNKEIKRIAPINFQLSTVWETR